MIKNKCQKQVKSMRSSIMHQTLAFVQGRDTKKASS